jgi:recombination protein RecR
MADVLPKPVQKLIRILAKLPGVGPRTAMRHALFLVREGPAALQELSDSLAETARSVTLCTRCYAMAGADGTCEICAATDRLRDVVCVVESIGDLLAVENTGSYRGSYFVLHRLLSPLKGIGPDDLRVPALQERIRHDHVTEVVLATPLTTDGETTATFLARLLTPMGVAVTRLASGVPVGGTIEYLDRLTLSRAFQDRKSF